jgi:adenylate cyclase
VSVITDIGSAAATALKELRRPGETDLPGYVIWRVVQAVLTLVIVVTNLIGAAAVVGIANFVVPLPAVAHASHVRLVNAIAAIIYVAIAVPLGILIGTWRMFTLKSWLYEERPATVHEMRIVLYGPLRLFGLQVALWLGAAILFAFINLSYSSRLAIRVAVVIVLTGVVTGACAYLLTERIMRPAAARALAEGSDRRFAVPGVATRAVLAWMLGSGLPVLGVVAIGVLGLTHDSGATLHHVAVAVVVLGAVGIAVGLLAVTVAARATADPVESVRRALSSVQRGELDVHVPVYDGTQIGQLQLGFNQMVAGLAERERIRDAFGTYVDPDVAAHILEEGTNLAGEEVEVTIMFIDIRDFTGFAEDTDADRVVAAINELFEQIVPIVHDHGGHVDKFVGDGLLAVFGAPRRDPAHAGQALEAALEIAERARSTHDLEIGIGLNSGTVVAGNVGGAGRLEFSVIGDPVNVAARVEAATKETGDKILLTERTKELLNADGPKLVERTGVELKGRREPVRVFAPEK